MGQIQFINMHLKWDTTALTQITDHWLQEMENKNLVGSVMLD